nr:uncharacterized protein LOC112697748 [Arachis hypogaea]
MQMKTSETWFQAFTCKIVVQFEKYRDFHDALRVLCSRSLQKQGSRLKADYEVSWDRDGFFRNTRNQTQEKTNRVSTMAADHYKSEAPRRHTPYARHSQRMCDQGDSGNKDSWI